MRTSWNQTNGSRKVGMGGKRRESRHTGWNRAIAAVLLLCMLIGAGAMPVLAAEPAYYVCFSNQNYAVRNANKMTLTESGEYLLENVSLSSTVDFYITDNAGMRWYASNNKPLSVEEAELYAYDIKFSPDTVYAEKGEWENTGCHITYRFYEPASYAVSINGEDTVLSYNPYFTRYELYTLSSVYLTEGSTVTYGEESHTVASNGYYRVLFTPAKTVSGNVFQFDSDGNYGSGDDFCYSIYMEDAPRYFAVFKDGIAQPGDLQIDGKDAYLLTRYENNVTVPEYRTARFFVGEREYEVRFRIYEETVSGSFQQVDEDDDDSTSYTRRTADDAGWYTLGFTDAGSTYTTALHEEETQFGGWYLVGEFNGYGFDADGVPALSHQYAFTLMEEGDDDYDEDYEQYRFELTVTEKDLKEGDVEFYITDGKTKYKNGTEPIALNAAGTYQILFSEEHIYGRGRHYRYTLEDEDKAYTELTVGSVQEFLDFAEQCSRSADYSVGLKVYLTADLDFSGVSFVPVGSFSGIFCGGYHSLKNITFDDGGEQTAIFSVVTRKGTVERLLVENITLGDKHCDYVGVIGRNYGTVQYVSVSGTVTGKNYVGGVVAYNGRSVTDDDSATVDSNRVFQQGTVKGCENHASVTGESYVGGVCGFNSGEVLSGTSEGSVSGKKGRSSSAVLNLGGIAGYSAGRLSDCINRGEVRGGDDSLYVGGIVGMCTGEIYYSFNYAKVTASKYAGGICGYYGTVQQNSDDLNNYFTGMDYQAFLDRYFSDSGEDFEQVDGNVHSICYTVNEGEVSAFSYAGGIVGNTTHTGLTIRNSAGAGTVRVTAGSYAGGIAGYSANAGIIGCMSTGIIEAKGMNSGTYAGGIAGYGGNISYCMSNATVKGEDHLGGIAGFAGAAVKGCYTNVLIVSGADAVNIGAIAGSASAYNQSLDSFGGSVCANYYIGSIGGIQGRDYAGAYDYAAASIESGKLASNGALSPVLSEDFSCEYWQGGDERMSYPTLIYFESAEECEAFDDDEEWNRLFERYEKMFRTLTQDAAQETYNITFMEWNKDNGDLYDDDGVLQTDHFSIIDVIRVYKGQLAEIPALVYAQPNANGVFVYEGDEARYFVRFPEMVAVEEHTTVYAEYTEIVTSLNDPDRNLFVEGDFAVGTEVELVRAGDCYTLKLTRNGEEITVENVSVKFYAGDAAQNCTVFLVNGERREPVEHSASGEYVSFRFSSGDYFCLEENTKDDIPFWVGILVGAGGTAVVVGVVCLIVTCVSRKKRKSGKQA